MINIISSNYPCVEHIFMVPKVFEPLKFDCIYAQGLLIPEKKTFYVFKTLKAPNKIAADDILIFHFYLSKKK